MAERVGLVRPTSARVNYGKLAPVRALEPPHWMACRVTDLRRQGYEVVVWDMEVEGKDRDLDCDMVEVWCTGTHPSAWVMEREGARTVVGKYPYARIVDRVEFNPSTTSPSWDLFHLDQYRTHNWHGWGRPDRLYGTVHASHGCPFNCKFCTVNAFYPTKWSVRDAATVMDDVMVLYKAGIRNFKFMDELFLTNTMAPLLERMAGAGLGRDCNFWCYGRVDTVTDKLVGLLAPAGIKWVALGIESGVREVRRKYGKGNYDNDRVRDLVGALHEAGVGVVANFMFGFEEDTKDSMRETFELAYSLRCEYVNFYCMVAYPGTEVWVRARNKGWEVPRTPSQYSQYSYDFLPLPTNTLTAAEVLAFRDWAWAAYHSTDWYQSLVEDRYGPGARDNIRSVARKTLTRRLLGDTYLHWYRSRKWRGVK